MGSYYGEVASRGKDTLIAKSKPHVVLLTMPAPGHMLPFIALGKALARHGVKVTFLSSGVVSETLRHEVEDDEDPELDITVSSVVEDPIPEPENPRELVPWLFKLPPEEMADRVAKLMQKLSPSPCCLIVDVFLSWSAGIEQQLSIPRHFLITMSAATLSFMFSVPLFVEQGLLPVDPASNPNAEFNVPGVGNVAEGDVWEYFIKGGAMQNDFMITCLQKLTASSATATYLVNSVEELEPEVFHALKEPIPFTGEVAKVVSIGPLEAAFVSKAVDNDIASLELADAEKKNQKSQQLSSEIVQWLDAQPDCSVVYIAFGTIFSLQEDQIRELAHGLESSGQRFLWIIRPPESPQVRVSQQGDPVKEQITALLPPGFEERTKGQGMLYSSWAPQPRILAHKAVACFVSHCGWNSVLEAISTCTPILACPCFVDQWQNATYVEQGFKIGRAMKKQDEKLYERGQIESLVRDMMEGEEGRVARRNVVHLNQVLRKAVTPSSGSSISNLQHYVADIFALDQRLNHSGS